MSRILVVDHTPANIQAVAGILKGEGYQARRATTGHHALNYLGRSRPDLVLLDVTMPELDGFETAAASKPPRCGARSP